MRYGVIGSRSFNDYTLLRGVLLPQVKFISQIVSGGARGADTLGVDFAKEFDIPYVEFIPDYGKHGKKAPFIRNKEIVNNSDIVYAFWNGISTGTKHSLDYAKSKGIKSIVIDF